MKKVLIGLFSFGFSGILYAVTVQPIPYGPSVFTAAQVLTSTPSYVGQLVVCSNCASINGALGAICVSTEAANANNAYIIAGSSLTATTACK